MPLPECFYKYRSLSTSENVERVEDILVNNRLYFAPLKSFNDPFEGRVRISYNAAPTQKLNSLRNYAIQTHGLSDLDASDWASRAIEGHIEIPEALSSLTLRNGFRENGGFCTLSERNDDILMWAHYADGHKGICIELKPRTATHIKIFQSGVPVVYQSDFPVIDFYEDPPSHQSAIAATATKSDHWAYEKEWRLLCATAGIHNLPEGVISGVIMGCAISDEHRTLVTEWAARCSPPVLVYSASTKPREYALDIVLVDS